MLSKNHIYEKFHSKFCKHVLGVSKQTPDILAKAEMGRYPLGGTILKQTYCYWQHILRSDDTSLLYKALQVNINLDRTGFMTYYSRIKGALSVLEEKTKPYLVEKNNVKKNGMLHT